MRSALISPRFVQDFAADFEQVARAGEPFALARFGTAEFTLFRGARIAPAGESWRYVADDSPYSLAMREAVQCDLEGFHLGLLCPCCEPKIHAWLLQYVRAPLERLTFANLFKHANYARFRAWDTSTVAVVSCRSKRLKVPRDVLQPRQWDYSGLLEKLFAVDRPILVAAGPLAPILVYEYWRRAPRRQTIIDVGSALDPRLHGRPTRDYHRPGSADARRVCVWSSN